MNKSALIGISALIGGLAIYNKTFKSEYESEVFMANRIVAIRENKITPLNPKYTNLQQESYTTKIYNKYSKSPINNLYRDDLRKLIGDEGQNIFFNKNTSYIYSYLDFQRIFMDKIKSKLIEKDKKILIPYNTKLKLVVLSLAKKMQEIYDSQRVKGKNDNDILIDIKQNSRVQRGVRNYFDLISDVLEKIPNVSVKTLAGFNYGKDANNNFIIANQNNYDFDVVFNALISNQRGNFLQNIEKTARGKIESQNYTQINFVTLRSNLLNDLTESDIKFIEKDFKDGLEVGIYASTLDWMDFLKANPSVKTIGKTRTGDIKYYDTFFNLYDAPKQLRIRGKFTQVLDIALFEKAFSPAHLEEMIIKLTKEQKAILTKAIQKYKRQGNRKEVLEQEIIEPNKKIVTSAINKWFSEYDSIISVSEKHRMVDFYLYLISPRYEGNYNVGRGRISNYFIIEGKNWIQTVEIKEIKKDSKGIYKKTDMPLRRINYLRNLTELINVDDIQIPSTLKTDAKPRYETYMQAKIDDMESKIQSDRDKLKQSEIRLNNAKREKARIEKIL